MIEGELPPPPVEYYFGFEGAGLFAAPVFYPIAPGIGETLIGEVYIGDHTGGVLTDLDGDGDLDLFGLWETQTEIPQGREYKAGWLMAVNDGRGGLERGPVIEEVAYEGGVFLKALGADLTGDGKDEIAISRSNRDPRTEVWSIGPELEVEVLVQIDRSIRGGGRLGWRRAGELFVGGTTYEGTLEEAIAGTAEFFSTLAVWEIEQACGPPRSCRLPKTTIPFISATLPAMGYSMCFGRRSAGRRGDLHVVCGALGRGVSERRDI